MKSVISISIVFFIFSGSASSVTNERIASRYKVIGVIAEDKEGETNPSKKGGIAVLKDTATGKTLVLKAGLPFPGQREIKISQINKKGVTVHSNGRPITLTQKGFSGFEGEVATNNRRSPLQRLENNEVQGRRAKHERGFGRTPWDELRQGDNQDSSAPTAPPFPEEIDELFFQEFGETPIPPEILEDQGFDPNNRPLSREELMEKYNFDPEEFNDRELENMVSPPPSPWNK